MNRIVSTKMEDQELAKIRKDKLKPHPRAQTNILSHLFFWWELPIILKGWKKELTEDDLYVPLKEYKSDRLGDALEKFWQEELDSRKKPSLTRALVRLFGCEFMFYGFVFLPADLVFVVLQPYYLQKLLDYYSPNQTTTTRKEAYMYAGVLGVLSIIRIFFLHFILMVSMIMGMKVRVASSSLIYRHTLKLTKKTLDKVTSGFMINLLSNDATRFEQVFPFLHFVWIGPVELILGSYFMDVTLGHAAVSGVAIIILSLLLQIYISLSLTKIRKEVAVGTDQRIRLMNDVICGIQAIKMYTWEKPYSNLVDLSRRSEVKAVTKANYLRLFDNALKIHMSKICIFICILVAVLTHHPLTSQYVFAISSIYEIFKMSVVVFLPVGVIMYSETITSVQRIQEFLLHDFQKSGSLVESIKNSNPCITKSLKYLKAEKPGVSLTNVDVKWDQSLFCVLEDVTFGASPGEFIGVIGPAGCGKSTLLQVILREVSTVRGNLEVGGIISYASQDSWIFSSSIKQNILFGQSFDSEKYQKVIRVCALERDLTLFPHGDQTLVGERGVMLSGGQKARISLARAVYKDADVYLLDDPLSAVDAHVGRHILEECILEYLKHRCVILVTHQVHYLEKVTRLYQLKSGKIVKCGRYDQVIDTTNASETLKECLREEEVPLQKHDLQFEVNEHRSTGGNNKKIFKSYCLAAGGWFFTICVLFFFALSYLLLGLIDVFLTFWVNVKPTVQHADFLTNQTSLYIFSALVVLNVVVTHSAALIFTKFCLKSSKTLHDNMLHKVVHATMSFFNHHSTGRILNRFSKDLGSIDEILPLHLMNGITVVLAVLVIFIIIIVSNYWMIIPTLILTVLTISFGIVFEPTNRNSRRTEGITRSSIFAHMTASMQGLVTIRATNVENKLIEEFDKHQDLHSSVFYIYLTTLTAFGFWVDFIATIYIVIVIYGFFFLENMTAAIVGVSISQCVLLQSLLPYAMKTWAELDAQMTSVERVVEYGELKSEADNGTYVPPDTWPTKGNIRFSTVSLIYSINDPPVLKKITFNIKPGEKVGIVGRTGAGKTSLISVLFRLFHFEGIVTIDGVNTKSIPLETLRSKISIIPQEPVLFLGTLRKNIDPFNEYSDHHIWSAIEELELKEMISNLPSGFESPVSERGSNFSVGERQLLCLLRTILKNNKIMVLDEATANIDMKTDSLIQSIIRKKFKKCTVLTIAHRLNTVMDSDKILVMESGMVVEFDHPDQLLKNTDGFFRNYVNEHGEKSETIGKKLT